jgi:hypothetical protein
MNLPGSRKDLRSVGSVVRWHSSNLPSYEAEFRSRHAHQKSHTQINGVKRRLKSSGPHYEIPIHTLKIRDQLPSQLEDLSHWWRRNVAAFAPPPKRSRLPGKRRRFEESTSLLIVETGLRLVTLVLSLVGIIMNTVHRKIGKVRVSMALFRLCARTRRAAS